MVEESSQQDDGLEVTQKGSTSIVQADGVTDPSTSQQQEARPERPEGLPEGFDTWEDFGKAQLAKAAPAQQESPQEGALSKEVQAEVDQQIESLPEDSREKARPFFEEVAKTGALSDESRAAAAKAFGVTEEMVDLYVKGSQAAAQEGAQTIYQQAGVTEADSQEFKSWAEQNYSAEQIQAFNDGLAKDPAKTLKEAVANWKADGNGKPARDITKDIPGSRSNEPVVEGYGSVEEMTRDQADPRYASDPAFRAKVEAKIAAAKFDISRGY